MRWKATKFDFFCFPHRILCSSFLFDLFDVWPGRVSSEYEYSSLLFSILHPMRPLPPPPPPAAPSPEAMQQCPSSLASLPALCCLRGGKDNVPTSLSKIQAHSKGKLTVLLGGGGGEHFHGTFNSRPLISQMRSFLARGRRGFDYFGGWGDLLWRKMVRPPLSIHTNN